MARTKLTPVQLISGLLYRRQGGTTGAASWQTVGTSNTDTTSTNVIHQAGSVVTSGGSATVTFPASFSQIPLIFVAVNSASSANVFARVTGQTASSFIVTIITDAGSLGSAETINWLAIGQ